MGQAQTTLGRGAWPSVAPVAAPKAVPPAPPKVRKTPKVYAPINVADLSLCDDKLPEGRAKPGSKYDEIFAAAVKTGKTIKTPGGTAASVSNLARTWLKRNGHHEMTTRSISNYGDGLGRVWFIKTPPVPNKPAKKGRAA